MFNYAGHPRGEVKHPQAVEDHVEFRSQTISDSLAKMAALVRRKQPDALFRTEIPCQYGSKHPHAVSYRIGHGANPSSCDHADLVRAHLTITQLPATEARDCH